MASMAIRASKGGMTSVPQPSRFKFQHGQYPPSPQLEQPPEPPTIKPGAPSTRNYGKNPLGGNTGMTGLS